MSNETQRPPFTDPRRTDPRRNILWNNVGITEDVRVDVAERALNSGEYLMLCSDGLWEYIEDDEMQRIVVAAGTPQAACDRLVALANARGGEDNISVIIIQVND